MSTFRPPPAPKLPNETDANTPPESLRAGALRPSLSVADEVPPLSTRFDKLGPANALAQRTASPTPTTSANARPPSASAMSGAQAAAPFGARASKGGIYLVTRILERKHGAFFISRLILSSGINLRGYDSHTPDDPSTITKFVKSLRTMLSPADMADLLTQAPVLMNMK